MAQFAVHRNKNPATKGAIPLLLDIQSDLLVDLGTRVVVPLCSAATMKGKLLTTLMPLLDVDRKSYAMLTSQLAGIDKKRLGSPVADLSYRRHDILAAVDLLITGI